MTFKVKRILLTVAPPLAAALVFALRRYILIVSEHLPVCRFRALTGLLCPGCGNTRAARELLSFHFLTAMRYNITIPLLIVFAVLLYAQYVVSAWVKPVRLVPRRVSFYAVALAALALYFVLRNVINFMP